jgi:hypothetical protein
MSEEKKRTRQVLNIHDLRMNLYCYGNRKTVS